MREIGLTLADGAAGGGQTDDGVVGGVSLRVEGADEARVLLLAPEIKCAEQTSKNGDVSKCARCDGRC